MMARKLAALARIGLALSAWPSCSKTGTGAAAHGGDASPPACDASRLFGIPNDHTGLTTEQCSPSCSCGATPWTPEPWTSARIAALKTWTLLDPPAELTTDPYAAPPPAAPLGQVCGFVAVDLAARTYRLETFDSDALATSAGAIVTHAGACGLCSTLADLAVYASIGDLTTPVRQCGIDTVSTGLDADVACIAALGFTKACAEIWAYDTQHTRAMCLSPCTTLLNAPYQNPDGTLNDCLQCDEDESGPVFKFVAGRTRRNTGVPSALCRPCDDAARLQHDYP